MTDSYYKPQDLSRFGEVGRHGPHLYQAFEQWYQSVMAEGALSKKAKALIALAVAHAIQCPYCIDAWATGSKSAGATVEEMTEAIHVAAAIRGGASLIHGLQALDAVERE